MIDFRDLLSRAEISLTEIDFERLRFLYTETDAYAPGRHDGDEHKELERALRADDLAGALIAVEELLANEPLDINTHLQAAYIYDSLEVLDKAAYHRQFAKGLLESILQSGDGQSFDTAFTIIDRREAYALMIASALMPTGQNLLEQEGHFYLVVEYKNTHTDLHGKMYFNVDLPISRTGGAL